MTAAKLELPAILLMAAVALSLAAGQVGQKNIASGGEESLVGDWRGESVCQVRESACHDEDSLYHVEKVAGKPHWISMRLDKIVEGKPVTMGTVECLHHAEDHTLTCEFPRGVFRFIIEGAKMQGTMTLPDKTVWRKISLNKVEWIQKKPPSVNGGFSGW
jgi:hypothetical protein